jgi:uncharacterized membrane protein
MKSRIPFYSLWVCSIILFVSWQMLQIVWPYTSGAWDIDFLSTKQAIIHLDHYRIAFYGHIFSSLLVLVSGAFLFSNAILRRWPRVHRTLGKTYVGLVLGVSAPTALVMGFYANGGWLAALSFVLLAPLWWYTTWQGYRTARALNFQSHRRWMLRSYALTFSAVTLRISQSLISATWDLDPVTQYVIVSWGSWIVNLVVIECYLRYKAQLLIIKNRIPQFGVSGNRKLFLKTYPKS